MSWITKIPMVHIQEYDPENKMLEGILEVSLMMSHSITHYYMTEEEVKAFAENVLEALEKSKIIVGTKLSQTSKEVRTP